MIDGILMLLFELINSLHSTDQQYDFIVQLETVLLGHEDWVYSVCWQPPTTSGM